MADTQWLQSLQSFLNNILTPILPDTATRYQYLGPEQMVVWGNAFTHESVSPTDNYEDLEYLGDRVLKYVFAKYLMERLPHLGKSEYTELDNVYMSKMYQAELSHDLGFGPFIRIEGLDRANLNVESDVFESFFGALEDISDKIAPGSGSSYCYLMISHLFKERKIDENLSGGSAKTQVIQMFTRFGLPRSSEIVNDKRPATEVTIKLHPKLVPATGQSSDIIAYAKSKNFRETETEASRQALLFMIDKKLLFKDVLDVAKNRHYDVEYQVRLKPDHLKFLAQYGVSIPDPVIGTSVAPTQKDAEATAYKQALETLAAYGINTEWAEEARINQELADPLLAPCVPAAQARLQQEGYDRMLFFLSRKTSNNRGAVVQLLGVRPDGKRINLGALYGTDDYDSYRETKRQLLCTYGNAS